MAAGHHEISPYIVHSRGEHTTIAGCVYAIVAFITVGAIFMGLSELAGAGSGSIEIREAEKRKHPVDHEWVWKKQTPRFEHMWRVPR